MMNLLRTIELALKSLMLHKLRSGLTMLGIVFGVFSVIAMLAIGEGASQQAQEQVLKLGATNIIVRSVKPPRENASNQSSNSFVLRYGLLRSDFDLLSKTIPTVEQAIPIREVSKPCRYLHREMNCRIVGCSPEYRDVNHLNMAQGRFISDEDRRKKDNLAVMAAGAAQTLFQYEDPIGKTVKVADKRYMVVGVTESREASAAIGCSMSGQDYNNDIYIPLETMRVRMGDLDVDSRTGSFSAEQVELNQITLRISDKDQVVATAAVIRESLAHNHKDTKQYSIVVQQELLKQAEQIKVIFNVVLGSIAAISLIVGGIGIMNIMLATVTERTREIGIRRALGAKQSDITAQFLTETMVLAGSGGLIGVVLGLLTPIAFEGMKKLATKFMLEGGQATSEVGTMFLSLSPRIVWSSLPLAFGISVGIGVIFGLYPARAAARMDPIEALRHE